MNEMDNLITLTDDAGCEEKFELLDVVEYEGNEYAVLLPADNEDGDEVVILQIEQSDNEEEDLFVSVDDDLLLDKVFEVFQEQYEADEE